MRATSSRGYHHGRLRDALLDETARLAAECGIDQVSVRALARRLGVSSAAPFRHFADRRSLVTALAEEGMRRLQLQVERGQAQAQALADPVSRLEALGRSFLDWALDHPTHFLVLSRREVIDFAGSAALRERHRVLRQLTQQLLEAAMDAGRIARSDPGTLALTVRATVYGLARMAIDGQLGQWDVPAGGERQAVDEGLRQLMALLARDAR